ncbi:unnamed protein product [Orchesella dallaii]|uniref:Uncharacterized protein n=1 Tax=Orchesella dallaii TaxID=48710 RepID=A0ABP1PLT3_9HEXA
MFGRLSNTHTFEEPLVVVVFRSDAATVGKGFDLRFSGNSNNSNFDPEYSYKLRHISSTSGTVSYPSSVWGVRNSTNKEIFVLAHSLNVKVGDDMSTMSTNISWSSGVFKKSNDSCQYGTVSFYSTPTQNGWTTRGQIPSANELSSCANSVAVPTKEDIWSTDLTAFLTIFKPISSEQDENSMSFTFTFSKSMIFLLS